MKLLLIEDDHQLATLLKTRLIQEGYEVFWAEQGEQALKIAFSEAIDLFILDVQLPDTTGFTLCEQLRNYTNNAILFLTALNDEKAVIQGLECGGDDFVSKPFRLQELLSRIKALLRRQGNYNQQKILKSGDLIFDITRGEIRIKDELIELGKMQRQILALLLENAPLIVTREILIQKLWENRNQFIEENTLNVHLSKLRKKIGFYQDTPYFSTVYGVGIRWNIPVESVRS